MNDTKKPSHIFGLKHDMTYFKRYFTYSLQSASFRTAVLTLIATILVYINVDSYYYQGNYNVNYYESDFSFIYILMAIAAFCIPMLETYQFKSGRNLDLLFTMPATRTEIALSHYLSGLIQLVVITMIPTIAATFKIFMEYSGFKIVYIIPMYLLTLLIGIGLYSITMFLFEQGNTLGDGIVFTVAAPYALILIGITTDELIDYKWADYWAELLNVYNIISKPFWHYKSLLEESLLKPQELEVFDIAVYLFWGTVALAAVCGYFYCFKNHRAETAGDISDSWFGYRTIIPVYAYSLLLVFSSIDAILLAVIVLVLMLIGYFIYRRSFRIKASDIVMLMIGVIIALF